MNYKGNGIGEDAYVLAAFRSVIDNAMDLLTIKDMNLTYVAASASFIRMLGKTSAEEIAGRTDFELFADENLAKRYVSDDQKLIESGENLMNYMEPLVDNQGQPRYGSTSKYILKDQKGKMLGILTITKDITRDYLIRQYYQQELRYLFELPSDTYAVCYIDVDSWRIISQRRQDINESTMQSCYTVESLCEAAVESIVDGRDALEFYQRFAPDFLREIYMGGRSSLSFQYQRRLSDDSIHWVENSVRFMADVDSGHLCAMLTVKNIDKKKTEEQKLIVAAKMDKMTMVLNRETTMENIRQILDAEEAQRHVLFMIDVDNFKSLNDTMGHQAGDEFLIELAAEMKQCFKETDVVGRIGGDEFFALMRDVMELSAAEEKAQELLAAIWQVCKKYAGLQLSGSIGISLYPENGKTLGELYAQADAALYQAKRNGKNCCVFAGTRNDGKK